MTPEYITTAKINTTLLELIVGDITTERVDAIVNAANSSLLGGGGVDGAIHRAAGAELLKETRLLGGCKTGDAKISRGYRLPAKHVIHAVGPIYQQNTPDVARLLASAYKRSLQLATTHTLKTVSFPAISTGVYGYPIAEAAPIALKTVIDYIKANDGFKQIRFVLFTQDIFAQFSTALEAIAQKQDDVVIT